jgi:hypothetical protein
MSVRMEVCANHETAMLTERVRQALAEIEYPEGVTEAEALKIRAEVTNRAMFDTSKEATLARKYEASAVRGFFNALKELRLIQSKGSGNPSPLIESVHPQTRPWVGHWLRDLMASGHDSALGLR